MIPGVPLYEHKPIPGVTQPGTVQLAQSKCVRLHGRSKHGRNAMAAIVRRFVNSAISAATRSAVPILPGAIFYLTEMVSLNRACKATFRHSVLQCLQPSEFGLPSMVLAGIPGKPSTQTGFGALTYTTSPRPAYSASGWAVDSTPRMIAFQARLGVLIFFIVPDR